MATQFKIDVRELLKVGAHFGHKTSHWNPQMRPYIHSKRGGIYIIDLIQTAELLEAALEFLAEMAASGEQILIVGTKRHLREIVRQGANDCGMPYVAERWFGGLLTNFETIHGRVKQLKKLEDQIESGELGETRSKREQLEVKEEITKLNTNFGGIKDMDKLPKAIFVADVKTEYTAISEAKRLAIPVVGVVDTNASPDGVDYLIPANDDAVSTVEYIVSKVVGAINQGKKAYKPPAPAESPSDKKPKVAAKKAADE